MSDRLLGTFLALVAVDSPSGEESAHAAAVADMLAEAGMDVRFDDAGPAASSDSGNLIATLPGTAPGLRVVLSAHLDCVEPCRGVKAVVEDGVVRSSGDTVLGADDKAGVAAIVETVRRVVGDGRPRPDVRVVLTVGEERGLLGAKALDPAELVGELCLVLDADGPVGGVITAAPTHYTFIARYQGRSAHAGVAPEQGVSALVMAAKAVAMLPVGRLDPETTANVGSMSGGTATNVVAPSAVVTGECRSLDPAKVEAVRDRMDEILRGSAEGGSVRVLWTKEYDGFTFSADDPLVSLVARACEDAGLPHDTFPTGGGSDGNIFSAKGVPTLVLANGMTGVHGTHETLAVTELEAMVRLLEAVLARAVG